MAFAHCVQLSFFFFFSETLFYILSPKTLCALTALSSGKSTAGLGAKQHFNSKLQICFCFFFPILQSRSSLNELHKTYVNTVILLSEVFVFSPKTLCSLELFLQNFNQDLRIVIIICEDHRVPVHCPQLRGNAGGLMGKLRHGRGNENTEALRNA